MQRCFQKSLSFVMVVITMSGLLVCKLHFYNMLDTADFKRGTAYYMPHTIFAYARE